MAETKYDTEIEKLRDGDQLSWAKVAKAMGLQSPSAARKRYRDDTGRDHSTSILEGKPGRKAGSSGGGSGKKRSRRKAGQKGMSGRQAREQAKGTESRAGVIGKIGERQRLTDRVEEEVNPVFTMDDSDHDVKAQISNHTIVVMYRNGSYFTVQEYYVYKVQAFGLSPRSGMKWVQFLDKDQKTRTIVVGAIVGIT